ncbi:MAG TPA: hypothetical protein DHV36_04390 [Desulfobacteraceae bacterium]|nr:hypothetical protein [Desulfobacteraceae bacterium]
MQQGARNLNDIILWILLLGIAFTMGCAAGGGSGQYAVSVNDQAAQAEKHFYQGRATDALAAYQKALIGYQADNNELGILMCLERMGWINREIGRYDTAENLLNRARPIGVRLNGDAAEIDASLGDVHLFRGDFDKAIDAFTRAIRTLNDFEFPVSYARPPAPDEMATLYRKSKAIVHARNNLGMLYYFTDRHLKAIEHLKASETLLSRINTVAADSLYGMFFKLDATIYEGMGYCYTMIGAVAAESGDIETSAAYLKRGRTAFVNGNKTNGIFMNEMMQLKYLAADNENVEQANRHITAGRYEDALEFINKGLADYEKNNDEAGQLFCLEKLGWLERETGNYSDALDHFRRAYDIGVKVNGDAAEIDASLGDVYLFSGDPERALTHYMRTISTLKDFAFQTRFAQPPSPGQMTAIVRKAKALIHAKDNMGILFYFEGQYDEALNHLAGAGSLIHQVWSVLDHPIYGKFFLHDTDFFEGVGFYHTVLGAVYAETGQSDKSAENFALGRQAFEKIGKDYGLMVNQALQIKGEYIRSGKPASDKDLKQFRTFLETAAAYGAQDIVWRMGYEIGKKLAREDVKNDARDFLKIAIDAIETTRSKLREDTIKKIFAGSVQDVYGEMINLLFDMGRHEEGFDYLERAKARAFLDMLAGRSVRAKSSVDPLLVEKAKKVQHDIDVLGRQLKTVKGQQRRAIVTRYEDKLKARSRIFEDIKDQSLSYAATASVATMSVSEIASALDKNTALISYFIGDKRLLIWVIKNGNVHATAVSANSATIDTLISDYREAIDTEEDAYVEETGSALSSLLITPVAHRIKGAKKLYIVPTGQLHYLPFSSLPFAPDRFLIEDAVPTILPNASSLFYFEGQVTRVRNSILAIGNPLREDDQPTLAFAEKEAAVVSRAFADKAVLTGETAKETAIKTGNLKDTAIIHIAAHGIYNPVHPLKSSLLLARDQANDGDLETLEIFSLSLNPRLVVLSACQSGVGKVRRGDEVQSLNRAFLYAGAGGVLASLWSVSDQSTYELMASFYNALKSQPPAQALRSAQLELMKTYPSPYHWAAFYLTGGTVK